MTQMSWRLAVTWLLLVPFAAGATPILDAGGQLLGASNVDVIGTLYDVSFVDGTG